VPPFAGEGAVEVLAHHLHSTPAAPSSRGRAVPEDLERVVLACIAKERDDRPQSAEALSRLLEQCRDAKTWSEDDAAAWWTRWVDAGRVKPKEETRAAGEPPRTIVCDLKRRLRGGQRMA